MTIYDVGPNTTSTAINADLATTYAFTFQIEEDRESSVICQVTAADGTITFPVYGTDYTIVRATPPLVGGYGQFLTAQTGDVVFYRKTPREQGVDLPNQGAFKAATVEGMADRGMALMQELVRDSDLAMGYPVGTDIATVSAVLPEPDDDKFLVGDLTNGVKSFKNSTLTQTTLSTYHTEALAAKTAAETAQAAAETAETNAETAETNAETAETNAETAKTAAETAQAAAEAARDAAVAASENTAWGYTFDSGTVDADPGTAKFRFNNATVTSATELYISQTADEGDIGTVIDLWDASTSTTKATLLFRNPTSKTNWVECAITGTATDNGAYWSVPIGAVVQGGSFVNNDELLLGVQKHGDAGTGAVDSFNGRVGAVNPANGDYSASGITNDSTVAGTNTDDALDTLQTLIDALEAGTGLESGAVTSSKIFNNSISLDKIQHGTSGDILYFGASGEPFRLAKGADDQVLQLVSGLPSWEDASGSSPILHVTEEQANNVAPASLTANTYTPRQLNTLVTNEISGSISSYRVSLPAGTYYFEGIGCQQSGGNSRIQLYNYTDSSVIRTGVTTHANASYGGSSNPTVRGKFTIAGTKEVELRQRNVGTSGGHTAKANHGIAEVYAELILWKVA